jgi:hypothetical protein
MQTVILKLKEKQKGSVTEGGQEPLKSEDRMRVCDMFPC